MIPVLEQCSMTTNSNFIIFAQDLMQDHAKSKDGGGAKRHSQRRPKNQENQNKIPHSTRFEWSNRVLIADGAVLSRDTKDRWHKVTKFLDGMISAHLVRNPEQLNNLKEDLEVQRIKYFERYPEAGGAFTATSSTTSLNSPMRDLGSES